MVKTTYFLLVLAAVLTTMLGTVKCEHDDDLSKCPANMHFVSCGSACPKNCAQLYEESACTMQCVPKCVCNDGYVLEDPRSTSQCIPLAQCLKCKRNNAFYTSCGTACPLNCQNYRHPPSSCTFNCVEGCFCGKGFVFRSGKEGMCVPPSRCPKTTQG